MGAGYMQNLMWLLHTNLLFVFIANGIVQKARP